MKGLLTKQEKQIENIINKRPDIEEKQSDVDIERIEKSEKEIKKLINKKEKGEITDDDLG